MCNKSENRGDIVGTEGPAHCQQLIKWTGRVSMHEKGSQDLDRLELIDRSAQCVFIYLLMVGD